MTRGERGEPAFSMDTSFVPLISGCQTGPLGFAHLPRLWLKMRAHAAGVLAEGYRHGSGGSDEALLTALGLELDAFAGFIAAETPDYPACEDWIRAHAADTSPATARVFSEYTIAFEMPDPRRTEWLQRFGLSNGAYTRAIGLNQLDDWDLVHAQLRGPNAANVPPVPGIGSAAAGPLGVLHLPRLWLKHCLHGVGRLAEGYRHGVGGFDEMLADALGFDRDAFAAYVETEQPDYLAAEAWVRRHAKTLTPEAIAAVNAAFRTTKMPANRLAERRAELGAVAADLELGIPLNDLDDWAGLHRQLLALTPR